MSEGNRSPSDEGVFGFSEDTLVVKHIRGLEEELDCLASQNYALADSEEELAFEVERLQGEVVDLRRERDDEKALAEGLSKRVALLQAEEERLWGALKGARGELLRYIQGESGLPHTDPYTAVRTALEKHIDPALHPTEESSE